MEDLLADQSYLYALQALQAVADKYKERPFSDVWVVGGVQPGLEANFGVGG